MSTDDQIKALEANREQLKAPLRERFREIETQISYLRAEERTLQAERDASIDNLTRAQLRDYATRIKAARAHAEANGALGLEEERKKILRALRDDDGKVRL